MNAPYFLGLVESEGSRWERFMHQRGHEVELLAEFMDYRNRCAAGSTAARICDATILQMMSLYVSDEAMKQYRQLSKAEEETLRANFDRNGLSVVELGMLSALQGVVAGKTVEDRLSSFSEFINLLYERWKIVEDRGFMDRQH